MTDNSLSKRPRSILFLCTTDIWRGPLAAQLLYSRKSRECGHIIRSAGIDGTDGESVPAIAQQIAQKWDVDLSHHEARIATPHLPMAFDLVLAMESRQIQWIDHYNPAVRNRTWLLGHWRDLEIRAPSHGHHLDFERVATEVVECVTDWITQLRTLDDAH